VFLKHYPEAVVLPPKIYYYEPRIFGFNIYKKRGSKFFEPIKGTIKYVEDSLTGIEREKLLKNVTAVNSMSNVIFYLTLTQSLEESRQQGERKAESAG